MNWCERVMKELDGLEPDLADFGLGDEWPEYLRNAAVQVSKAFAPSMQMHPGMAFGPKAVGGLLGHKVAAVKPFSEGLKLLQKSTTGIPEKLLHEFGEMEGYLGADYYRAVMRTMRRCIAIASQQPFEEMKQFFAGFEKAIAKGTITPQGQLAGATLATQFHCVLLMWGPSMKEKIKSMGELHAAFVRIWGPLAGDKKNTEKRCQRIGLSFAEITSAAPSAPNVET
jgi:hypothetical protein